MNIKLSFTSSVDIADKLSLTEQTVENLFNDTAQYILKNTNINLSSNYPGVLQGKYEEIEVDLYLCGNEEIHKLNKQYRNVDSSTDVLSFSMQENNNMPDLPILHLGEIVISIDKLLEQAEQNSHSQEKELVFLISHGLLHLLGLDHQTDETYKNIVDMQNEVINAVLH